MTGVCICVPSRGRPDKLYGVIRHLFQVIEREDTRIVVALDDDDPQLDLVKPWPCPPVLLHRAPREATIGARYDRIFKLVPDAALYIPHADDTIFLERGFDQKLLDAVNLFPNREGMVEHPAHGKSYCLGFGIGGGMARKLGTIGVPCFPYWWEETWWDEVGKFSCRLLWRDDVNMVPLGASGIDDARSVGKVTTGLRDVTFWAEFFDRTRPVRLQQAERLIEDELPFRKEQIRLSWPALCKMFGEQNSKLRDPAKAARFEKDLTGAAGVDDERYRKVKDDAAAYLREMGL